MKAGQVSNETICLTDLFRTCAAIVGQSLPDNAAEDSVSFVEILDGQDLASPLRAPPSITRSTARLQSVSANGNSSYVLDRAGGVNRRPRGRQIATCPHDNCMTWQQDPGETKNVAEQHPDVVEQLTTLLDQQVGQGRSTPGDRQSNDRDVQFLPPGRAAAE